MVKNSVRILCRKKLAGWMGGNWMDGWVDGWESGFKDCLQQSKIRIFAVRFQQQYCVE